jgi:hypothetical protein
VLELTTTGLDLVTRANDALHAWERSLDLPGDPPVILDALESLTAAIGSPRATAASVTASR